MEKTPKGPNPGLIWCNSKVTKPSELSGDSFCKWYSDVHVPDVLKTGTISEAFRYLAVDPNEELFHLTLYYAENVDGLYDKVKGKLFSSSAIVVMLMCKARCPTSG